MISSTSLATAYKKISSQTSEDDVVAFIETVRSNPSKNHFLIALLAENHPLFREKGANQVIRIRGYMMACFEFTGLPDAALPYALDELENGRSAYMVAAAAKAVRGVKHRFAQLVPYLLKAIVNIRYSDEALCFETYKPVWPLTNYTTALKEIFITFQWMGRYAKEAACIAKKIQ